MLATVNPDGDVPLVESVVAMATEAEAPLAAGDEPALADGTDLELSDTSVADVDRVASRG